MKCVFEIIYLLLSHLRFLLMIIVKISLDDLVEFWKFSSSLWIYNFMRNDLIKELHRRIKACFNFERAIVLLNKSFSCLSLLFWAFLKRWKLVCIKSQILSGWKWKTIADGFTIWNERKQSDKLGISPLFYVESSNHYSIFFNHLVHDGSKCSFILLWSQWNNYIYSIFDMVSWNLGLVSKSNNFHMFTITWLILNYLIIRIKKWFLIKSHRLFFFLRGHINQVFAKRKGFMIV